MNDLSSLKKQLKNSIIKEGISSVIKSLKGTLPEDTPKYNLLLNLEGEYKTVKYQYISGAIKDEDFRVVENSIRMRVITFIDEIEDKDFQVQRIKSNFNKEQTYKTGHILYQIPKRMQVMEETRCRVRIAFDKMTLLDDLDVDKDTKIREEVRVSDYMKVELIDPSSNSAFELRSTSEAVQFIDQDDFTEWRFYVKPILAGKHVLELKVCIILIINGKEIKREKTLEESVVIIAEAIEEDESEFVRIEEKYIFTESAGILKPPLKTSGYRMPKAVKSMSAALLLVMGLSVTSYAFVPQVELEVDWIWTDKIVASKAAYNSFVKKYEERKEVLGKVSKRIAKANTKVEDIEWQEAETDESGMEAIEYIKKYKEGRYIENAILKIKTIDLSEVDSKADSVKIVEALGQLGELVTPPGIDSVRGVIDDVTPALEKKTEAIKEIKSTNNQPDKTEDSSKNNETEIKSIEEKEENPSIPNSDKESKQSTQKKTEDIIDYSKSTTPTGQIITSNEVPNSDNSSTDPKAENKEPIEIPEHLLEISGDEVFEAPRTAEPPKDGKTTELPEILDEPEVEYPEEEEDPNKVYRVPEKLAVFPGCKNEDDERTIKRCSDTEMMKFIYTTIKYPPTARENGVGGTVVVQFVIDKAGKVKTPKVVKDIGAGCGEEALRIIEVMQKEKTWQPATQRGRPVNSLFNLPIRFRLE